MRHQSLTRPRMWLEREDLRRRIGTRCLQNDAGPRRKGEKRWSSPRLVSQPHPPVHLIGDSVVRLTTDAAHRWRCFTANSESSPTSRSAAGVADVAGSNSSDLRMRFSCAVRSKIAKAPRGSPHPALGGVRRPPHSVDRRSRRERDFDSRSVGTRRGWPGHPRA
jgi:hypothetical protein